MNIKSIRFSKKTSGLSKPFATNMRIMRNIVLILIFQLS